MDNQDLQDFFSCDDKYSCLNSREVVCFGFYLFIFEGNKTNITQFLCESIGFGNFWYIERNDNQILLNKEIPSKLYQIRAVTRLTKTRNCICISKEISLFLLAQLWGQLSHFIGVRVSVFRQHDWSLVTKLTPEDKRFYCGWYIITQ